MLLITEQLPDERVAWKATDGKANAGVVTFHRIGDESTQVMVQIEHESEGVMEKVGSALRGRPARGQEQPRAFQGTRRAPARRERCLAQQGQGRGRLGTHGRAAALVSGLRRGPRSHDGASQRDGCTRQAGLPGQAHADSAPLPFRFSCRTRAPRLPFRFSCRTRAPRRGRADVASALRLGRFARR